jgi:hypothetical protein
MKFKMQYIWGGVVLALVVWFVLEATTQPGIDDLEGDPEEIAFVRNENNTGPVRRVYAVSIADTLWQEMQKYGSYMPHNKYGSTQVYFFLKDDPAPENLHLDSLFDSRYKSYVLAKYEKNAMGTESFARFPFSED